MWGLQMPPRNSETLGGDQSLCPLCPALSQASMRSSGSGRNQNAGVKKVQSGYLRFRFSQVLTFIVCPVILMGQ